MTSNFIVFPLEFQGKIDKLIRFLNTNVGLQRSNMDPNETTGEEHRGIRDVVHEKNCKNKLEREGNK